MAGYTRQAAANIVTGGVIDAADFNAEYNALEGAFNAGTGHTHDGTTGNGPPIEKVGPSQDLVVTSSVVRPKTDNTYDFGTSSIEWKDGFFDGTLRTDILTVDETSTFTGNVTTVADVAIGGNLTVTGNATINGNLTFGDADTDTVSFGADIDSNIIPDDDGAYDLGSSTKEWRDLFIDGTANIDSLVADTADINGGSIDGTVIGANATAAITGTTITGTSVVGPLTGNVTGNLTGNVTGNVVGDVTGNITSSGTSTFTTVDINGGNVDGTIIGAASAAAITGTTITGSSFVGPLTGNVTGNVTGDITGNVTGNLTGNASTATALQNARTIAGNSFDGTSNIDIAITDLTSITASADEVNKLDGFTGGAADLNYAKDLRATGVSTTEFDKLDGLNATTAELNIMDGNTAATSTTVVAADRVVLNDNGTMKQVAMSDIATYTSSQVSSPNNATITITAGNALTGGGNFTTDQSGNETITINHQDTSSQGSVNNSGSTYIQDISLDTYGHVTSITSTNVASNVTVGPGITATTVGTLIKPSTASVSIPANKYFILEQTGTALSYLAVITSGGFVEFGTGTIKTSASGSNTFGVNANSVSPVCYTAGGVTFTTSSGTNNNVGAIYKTL